METNLEKSKRLVIEYAAEHNVFLEGNTRLFEIINIAAEPDWLYPSKKQFPRIIKDKDFSENVLAVCNGVLMVMCYAYVDGLVEEGGYCWHNCYGNIDGDGEFDDNYIVDKWQYLPKI